jgi:ribA/ribD-fused uncharacterized protein
MKIYRFIGEYEFLSNFHPVVIIFEGIRYASVEHAYVASKTMDKQFRKKIAKLTGNYAALAKKMGRKCRVRPGWEEIKLRLMRDFLTQKFTQEPLKTQLLQTGDQELIEGNYWHDNYWGECICEKCNGVVNSQNHLGKLLMEIREKVKGKENVSTVCYSSHGCDWGVPSEVHSTNDPQGDGKGSHD